MTDSSTPANVGQTLTESTTAPSIQYVREFLASLEARTGAATANVRTTSDAETALNAATFARLAAEYKALLEQYVAALRPDTTPRRRQAPPSVSRLTEEIANAFRSGKYERFHDGEHSAFSRNLTRLLEVYGTAAVTALESVVASRTDPPEVIAEALRWLPFVAEPEAYKYRMNVLEQGLRSLDAIVRDAATTGLGVLDDVRAVPALEAAVAAETVPEIRAAMQETIQQLHRTWARS